ncbi:ATP-grasp domain-containing protein [Novosphingobium profundi]|uniref:ATP-grasp domain-containing protein n=1 Tax=Novosphingobium profundi TaxID=1774954 RepID=UPI001BDAA0F9|nr:ATP-grasp domain-containing protein [Novosphingobium profundi]MBT0671477.1 ATP-grasp domain-containing protein [Novosphingobium profundi]
MRIWFNRGFSLAPIAKAMMAADPTLEVFVSTGAGLPIYEGPTQTWVEPKLDDQAYLDWVCSQITEHAIDVFVPTARRHLFASADMPCKVHLPADIPTLDLLEDKFLFAKELEADEIHLPTICAQTKGELVEILAEFRAAYPDIDPCVKPRLGVNGHGFWTLSKTVSPLAHLMNPDARRIREDLFIAALAAEEEEERVIRPLVLMPFLPGPEVSFDVLAHRGAILKYVARTKEGTRQRLQTSHPLEAAAKALVDRFSLHGIVNVQFRRAEDASWKALEINSRPAGGSVYGEPFGTQLIGDWGGLLSGRLAPEQVSKPTLDLNLEMATGLRELSSKRAA